MRRLILGLACVGLLSAPTHADVLSAKVTVTTAATTLATVPATGGRLAVEVSHGCASAIFVGGPGVSTTTGRSLSSSQSLSILLVGGGETLLAIYASGTCVVTVLSNGAPQ